MGDSVDGLCEGDSVGDAEVGLNEGLTVGYNVTKSVGSGVGIGTGCMIIQNKNGEVRSQDVHKSYFKLNRHCNLHLVLALMSAMYLERL